MNKISYEDLYQAFLDCRKRKTNTPSYIDYEPFEVLDLIKLLNEINNKTYKIQPSSAFVLQEKSREIFAAQFRDRIVHHFLVNEIGPLLEKQMIYDSSSCRKGKGTSFAIERLYRFMVSCSQNFTQPAFTLKLDISGFFMSIDREQLYQKLFKTVNLQYKGKYKEIVLWLIDEIVHNDVTKDCIRKSSEKDFTKILPRKSLFYSLPGKGLAIGNITSQLFANYYLTSVDHSIKHSSQQKYYQRYVDDMVLVCKTKEEAQELLKEIEDLLTQLGLKISVGKTTINEINSHQTVFLGKILRPFNIQLNTRLKRKCEKDFSNYNSFSDLPKIFAKNGILTSCKSYIFLQKCGAMLPENIQREIKFERFKILKKNKSQKPCNASKLLASKP